METIPSIWAFFFTVAVIAILWIILHNVIGRIYDFITIAILKHRKKKHPELFFYIKSYNNLVDSSNEWYQKEILPLRKKIDDFYKNMLYYPKEGLKQREFTVERQKNLLEDAQENYQKIYNNAQDYYLMIKNYTESHKIKWANDYIHGFN